MDGLLTRSGIGAVPSPTALVLWTGAGLMERALLREICQDWRVLVVKHGRGTWGYAETGARCGSCVVCRCERGAVDWRFIRVRRSAWLSAPLGPAMGTCIARIMLTGQRDIDRSRSGIRGFAYRCSHLKFSRQNFRAFSPNPKRCSL